MSPNRNRVRVDGSLVLRTLNTDPSEPCGPVATLHSLPDSTLVGVIVAEVSGTDPVLAVVIQGSDDGEEWTDLLTLQPIDAPGFVVQALGAQAHTYYRAESTVTGTDNPAFVHLIALTC